MGYPKTILSYPYPIFVLTKINLLKYKKKINQRFILERSSKTFLFFLSKNLIGFQLLLSARQIKERS